MDHEPADDKVDTMPPFWREYMMSKWLGLQPDAEYRRAFEARKPALGLNSREVSYVDVIAVCTLSCIRKCMYCTYVKVDYLVAHSRHPDLLPTQRRSLFHLIRGQMLRHLISTSGCTTVIELANVLKLELKAGIPAPVPDW